MLANPVTMGELKSHKKKISNVSSKKTEKSKYKSANETFFTPQKRLKGRK